ncbi:MULTISPECIES: shikimate kinase [unclassified Fusibacter]|uniref:shikimate kinase n=1 Tax=unclassified Fusibacter TaxID=2624464 RepID=UPI00101154D3|nr:MULTISPECIES: shikimate kinase [unclassified Fusibacter]MCK8059945.1 shikimate kinase [Fusibacter sp. A2]NPE22087.1 shikimate kinase [Fusibacter sp. A1]RXV60866.1 shikimate kinase [Fusibacter sp. A1]
MMVFIIGITGVGKSSIGRMLAKKLNFGFVDLDAWIEIRSKKRIPELFSEGESVFRDWETESLKALPTTRSLVVATGGGVVTREENVKWMRSNGLVIQLDRPIDKIVGHINTKKRPMLKDDPSILYKLYHKRKQSYKRARHVVVNCSNRKKALRKLVEEVRRYENSNHKRP